MAQVKLRGELIMDGDKIWKSPSGLKPHDILAMMAKSDSTLTLEDIEIIGGKQSSLESPTKMDRLGVPNEARKEYLDIIKVGRDFEDKINAFIQEHDIYYVFEGIKLDTHVGSGCYIQNPDSVPAHLQKKADK